MLRRSSVPSDSEEKEKEFLLPSSPGNNSRIPVGKIQSPSRIPGRNVNEEGSETSTEISSNNTRRYQRLTSTVSPSIIKMWSQVMGYMNSTRLMVLVVLCLQNSLFTVLRRYSQGVLQENYSKVRK